MGGRLARLAVIVVGLALAGCGTGTPLPPPPAAGTEIPDLRGTWTGTWGGTPLTLVFRQHDESGPGAGGIYLGSWQIAGERRPTVDGIITFTQGGAAISTAMRGWLGQAGRGFRLVIEALPGDGRQELVLSLAGDRMTGTGTSGYRWGPQGPVELRKSGG